MHVHNIFMSALKSSHQYINKKNASQLTKTKCAEVMNRHLRDKEVPNACVTGAKLHWLAAKCKLKL